jgi:hypothetical protein
MTAAEIDRISHVPLVFIVGKERSGTTLLQVMLNAHPAISAPPESRFIILLYRKYGKLRTWTTSTVKAFCDDLFRERLFREFWKVDREALEADLRLTLEKASFSLFCRIVYAHAFPGKNAAVFIDKNPVYYFFLTELQEIFPDAKFIHLVRDYRANILSHRQVFQLKSSRDIAFKWLYVNRRIERLKAADRLRFFTLKYEDLVAAPETELRGICSFLGLPYDEAMRDHVKSIYPSFREQDGRQFSKIHGSLFAPVSGAHVDKWRSELSPKIIADAEAIAGGYAQAMYGYEPVKENRKRPWLLLTPLRYFLLMLVTRIFFLNRITSPKLSRLLRKMVR